MKRGLSKHASLTLTVIVYLAAAVIGVFAYRMLPFTWQTNLLIADAAATVIVFIFSVIYKNASIYDPYWSVQPMFITAAYALAEGTGGAGAFALLAIFCWGIRLTGNWVYTFRGYGDYEDWRYIMLREKTGSFYPVINFTGIHMVPTIIVYACTLPAVYLIKSGAQLNILSAVFILLSFGSIYLELSADMSMHRFRRSGHGSFIREGLWKYSRHPNYLGEISFWWFTGLALVSVYPDKWYLLFGAFVNTLLFAFVSIPMADEHQARKAGYAEYRVSTRALLPVRKQGA